MIKLEKPIRRMTAATQYSASRHRRMVVVVEPAGRESATVGVRLEGTRQTFRVGLGQIYTLAVQIHLNRVEKKAMELHKNEKIPMRSARARARKELAKELI